MAVEQKAKMGLPVDEIVVTLCFALCVWSGWLTGDEVFPSIAPVFPFARDAGVLCSALVAAAVALGAYFAPRLLNKRAGAVASAAFLVAAVALFVSGVAGATPIGACAFTISYSVGFVFPQILSVAALALLKSNARRLLCISAAFVVDSLVRFAGIGFGASGDTLARLVVFAVVACLLWKRAGSLLDRFSAGQPVADLEAESPNSFLRPMHALFLCIFLVSAISGFGSMIAWGDASGSWSNLVGVAAVVLAAGLAFKRASSEDVLFSLVYLGIVAGLMLVPFSGLGLLPAARAVIAACSLCFSVLFWLAISSVGSRNLSALLPTLGIASFAEGVGTMLGAFVGSTAAESAALEAIGLFAVGAAFTFVAFIWLFFRNFSFSQTIAGIEPAAEIQPVAEADGALSRRSQRVAQRCGLTAREAEILDYLAHGRNTRFIQEKLVISPNTVRTHIKHIYQKLDVHSQQELIDLVSGEQA